MEEGYKHSIAHCVEVVGVVPDRSALVPCQFAIALVTGHHTFVASLSCPKPLLHLVNTLFFFDVAVVHIDVQ